MVDLHRAITLTSLGRTRPQHSEKQNPCLSLDPRLLQCHASQAGMIPTIEVYIRSGHGHIPAMLVLGKLRKEGHESEASRDYKVMTQIISK